LPLLPGSRLGVYEVTAKIGEGGMGEVYRARDTKLNRAVALKILPEAFSLDPDRLARFSREAQLLATLNHPYIATIYGFEESQGLRALVLELVEGPTLADRLRTGPIPIDDALPIARQIAEALDAAHEHAIIHRDLKPANIKLRQDGTVKILDFGLAKVLEQSEAASADAIDASTITADGMTHAGVLLGTAGYMSPEQARGQPVDRRGDIWAFGCVLYEMLTGRRAFTGETVTDILASVTRDAPSLEALPSLTPLGVRLLIARCLERDPKRRLRDIGDARFELEAAGDLRAVPHPIDADTRRTARISKAWWFAVVVFPIGALAAWWVTTGRAPMLSPRVIPLTTLPGAESFEALSPDGAQIAFVWNGGSGSNDDIYVQRIGSESPSRLTTDPAEDTFPTWSPDGTQIAFLRRSSGRDGLYVIAPPGGAEVKIAEFSQAATPYSTRLFKNPLLSWSPDGHWLAVTGDRVTAGATPSEPNSIVLVSTDGATRRALLPVRRQGEYYESPAFSPSGSALAFSLCEESLQCRVFVADLTAAFDVKADPRRLSTEFEVVAGIAWTEDGKDIVYGAASVWLNTFHLWRVPAAGTRPPERIDLAGVASLPSTSKSGHRLTFNRRNFDLDVWRWEPGRDPTPIVVSSQSDYDAYFSHDGRRIAFVTDRRGEGSEVWTAFADGTGLKSLTKGTQRTLGSPRWSPDNRWIAFDGKGGDGRWHTSIIDSEGGPPRPLTPPTFAGSSQMPSWSPDGRWIYFSSTASGQSEIWRTLPSGSTPEQVTQGGGSSAAWLSQDGNLLYFLRNGALMAKTLPSGPERRVIDSVNAWQYAPVDGGVFFVPEPATRDGVYELRFLEFKTGQNKALTTIHAAYFGNGLSASPTGVVIMCGVTTIDADIMLIENFR
jgi:serine/threonine protein kinase